MRRPPRGLPRPDAPSTLRLRRHAAPDRAVPAPSGLLALELEAGALRKRWLSRFGALVRMVSNKDDIAGVTPMSKWVPQGVYELTVTLDGHTPHKRVLDLGAGEALALTVALESEVTDLRVASGAPEAAAEPDPAPAEQAQPKPAAAPEPESSAPGAPAPAPAADPEVAASGGGLLPWVVLGSGAALLAGGAVFGVLRNGAYDELADIRANGGYWEDADAAQQAMESHALAANVLFGAGVAALVAGGVLLLTAGGGDETSVELLAPPGGIGVAVGGAL